jgi:Domain of unknown function (DUF362)/FlgD Ig-like domain
MGTDKSAKGDNSSRSNDTISGPMRRLYYGKSLADSVGSRKERNQVKPKPAAPKKCAGKGGFSRRQFLKNTAIGTAGILAAPSLLNHPAQAAGRGAKVVRTFHSQATTGWSTVNQEPVNQMMAAAIRQLTGIGDLGEAWKSFFPDITADKKISIKINLACGDVPTHPEVVNAIIDGLLMMDLDGETLPENHIIVWDIDNPFFCPQTGYTVNYGGPGVQYFGTNHPSVGHDMNKTFSINHDNGNTSYHHVSKIISQMSDYMIDAAVLKDHDNWAGVTLCLKNHYGSVDGVMGSYDMHYDGYNTGIPGLNAVLRDNFSDLVKLWIIDGAYGLCDGGPGYTPPGHTPPNWIYNSLFVGNDPVAIDRIGEMKINEERAARGMSTITAQHIYRASQPPFSLGEQDPAHIDLVEINAETQDVGDSDPLSQGISMLTPYPNPAPGTCTLRFASSSAVEGRVWITDATGRLVRRVAESSFGPGSHRFSWDGRDEAGRLVPSGSYFFQLQAGKETRQRHFILVR